MNEARKQITTTDQGVTAQDHIDVPGGSLRYRYLPVAAAPVLVFENGWGASHEQWAWIERELAGRTSLLFYSHAGVGGSAISCAQSPNGISDQFAALLDALNISVPVVLVGHSFGGLICALHAVQRPERVAAVIQLDNTQEVNDAALDNPLKLVKHLSALAILCARLSIRDPLFSGLSKMLPPEEGARMQKLAFGSAASMRAAMVELDLIPAIREAIAVAPASQARLVISADRAAESTGFLSRLLSKSEAALSKHLQRVQSLHQAQATRHGGRWMTLPHSHADLVFTAEGAADTARQIRAFIA